MKPYTHISGQLMLNGQVELEEEADSQGTPVGHHASRDGRSQGHLLSQGHTGILQQTLIPWPAEQRQVTLKSPSQGLGT